MFSHSEQMGWNTLAYPSMEVRLAGTLLGGWNLRRDNNRAVRPILVLEPMPPLRGEPPSPREQNADCLEPRSTASRP